MLSDFVRGWPHRKRESNQTPGRTSQTRRNAADGSRVTRLGMSLICGLLNLRRAGLTDPIDAALDEPLVPRRFPQSTPLQHSQEPCEWQARWQVSSPSSRRPSPHGGSSQGNPIVFSWAHWQIGRGLLSRQPTVWTLRRLLRSARQRPR